MLKGMLERWREFLRKRRVPPKTIVDDVLGTLMLDGKWWEGGEFRIEADRVVEVSVFGDRNGPSPEALDACRRFAREPAALLQLVAAFLRSQAMQAKWRPFAAEILRLRIHAVSLGRDAPLAGWIFLEESDEHAALAGEEVSYLAWRCWYADGVVSGLAFDS